MPRTKAQARKLDPNKPRTIPLTAVGTSSGAGTRANPPRAGRPVQKPPLQVYQRKPPPKKKEKPPVENEEVVEEGLIAETESEEEDQASEPASKRKKVPPKTRNPTTEQLHERFTGAVKWYPMRFPDPDTLRSLGLYEDVRLILQNIGMESFLTMSYGVHKEVSCQFLSTLAVSYHCSEVEEEGFGVIAFKIRDEWHKVGFKKIGSKSKSL